MISNEYEPRKEFANIRRLGSFGEPNPANYLGKSFEESKSEHPSQLSKIEFKKPKIQLDDEEKLNLFKAILFFVGTISIAVGVYIAVGLGFGIIAFGVGLWALGLLLLKSGDAPSNRE